MLELLLYCHMIANMRFAGHIAAVVDFIGEAKLHCSRLFAPVVRGSREPASAFGAWTERELMRSLDRLEVYVSSMA
jgi:hypothetical protein